MADDAPHETIETEPRAGLTEDELEAGRKLFASECRFFFGAQKLEQVPPPAGPEIAFAGRSNVGKSSLLNALTGRNALARTSSEPGRTRQLNFFDLGGQLTLVDMPGYGYARASKQIKADWQGMMFDYLRGRTTLLRVMLLLDSRIEAKQADRDVARLDLDPGVQQQHHPPQGGPAAQVVEHHALPVGLDVLRRSGIAIPRHVDQGQPAAQVEEVQLPRPPRFG